MPYVCIRAVPKCLAASHIPMGARHHPRGDGLPDLPGFRQHPGGRFRHADQWLGTSADRSPLGRAMASRKILSLGLGKGLVPFVFLESP